MLKSLKLRKLKKEYNKHREAADFCCKQLLRMFRKMEFLTNEGEEKWQNYSRRFNIHMKAYEHFRAEYNKLNQSY